MKLNGYRIWIRKTKGHEGETHFYPEDGGGQVASGWVWDGGRGWSWRIDWPFKANSGSEYVAVRPRKEALIRMTDVIRSRAALIEKGD